jgi:hypothetical protein
MGKQRLVPHLIVEGGFDASGFYEKAFGRVRGPFGSNLGLFTRHIKRNT